MRLGAATEPLDGRTFTVVVDARAGEGAGNSAASPWCFSPLLLAVSSRFGGGFEGQREGQAGGKGKEKGSCYGWTPGGAVPYRRRRGRRPRGRRPVAASVLPGLCRRRRNGVARVSRVALTIYIPPF
jgi:hypothetical protein